MDIGKSRFSTSGSTDNKLGTEVRTYSNRVNVEEAK